MVCPPTSSLDYPCVPTALCNFFVPFLCHALCFDTPAARATRHRRPRNAGIKAPLKVSVASVISLSGRVPVDQLGSYCDWGRASLNLWTDAHPAECGRCASFRLVTFDVAFSKFSGLNTLLLEP